MIISTAYNTSKLRTLCHQCLIDLSAENGIYASSRNEAFGCLFGRDSALTILKMIRVHTKSPSLDLLHISRRTLQSLLDLQGKTYNLESGEEPGKFIHEFRPDNYARLINREKPWYVYSDGKLRNYDSIDATPLTLISLYRYWKATQDNTFLLKALPGVEAGLNWIISFGDKDKDLFLEYELPKKRIHGGLVVQSWTDSQESLLQKDGIFPKYPIAAIEVQAFTWLSLMLWADFYEQHNQVFGKKIRKQAKDLKEKFNRAFLFKDRGIVYGAQALDGYKRPIKTITGNPLLCLWATYQENGKKECIVEDRYISDFVRRAFMPDMFDKTAGIRTMSTLSPTFNPGNSSYHNGSFWPILNGLAHEGLENWEYATQATKLKHASLLPIAYFQSPIELYIKTPDSEYGEYVSAYGKKGCRFQAWSAAAALDWLT